MSERKRPDLFRISEALVEAIDGMTARAEGAFTGLSTGLTDLDALTGGLHGSDLTVIGGRPSMGTTALAVDIVDHVTRVRGKTVLYVALNQSGVDLTNRFLAARASIPLWRIATRREPSHEEIIRLGRAYNELQNAPLWIHAPTAATVAEVAAQARTLDRLDLIVVDRLGDIESDSPHDRRADRLARVCLQLRQLAREHDVPVVALAHLSRDIDRRPDHRPRLRDFDRTWSISEASDVVLLLHRPEFYDPNDEPGTAVLTVAKNGRGLTGDVKLSYDRSLPRFRDLEGMRGHQEGWF